MIKYDINLDKYIELKNYKKACLNKKIEDIFDIGYNLMFPKVSEISSDNSLIMSKLEEIKKSTPQIFDLNRSITQLIGITSNSSKKGEFVENIVESYINKKYSSSKYDVKRNEAHCGDGWLSFDNNKKIIVEVKSYSKTVNETEVNKLRYDMKYNKINYGILISLGSKIQNSKLIDLEIFNNDNSKCYIIKIGPINNNKDILDIGFDFIEKITNLYSNDNNKLILKDNLLNKMTALLNKINQNQNLKNNYNSLTVDIYRKMDNFNQEMTLLFLEQKNLINEIISEINNNTINNIEIEQCDLDMFLKYEKYKIYANLVKIINIIKEKKITFNLEKIKL